MKTLFEENKLCKKYMITSRLRGIRNGLCILVSARSVLRLARPVRVMDVRVNVFYLNVQCGPVRNNHMYREAKRRPDVITSSSIFNFGPYLT